MGRTANLLAGILLAGLMLLGVASRANANLVVNGDFETGDFTGWSQSGDTSFDGVDGTVPQSGNYAAYFGSTSGSSISQILTTLAGELYQVDFWLATENDVNGVAIPNHFEFDWNGALVTELTDAPGGGGYTHYTFTLLATSASSTINFSFLSVPAFWDFDTVSAEAAGVPEPGSLALVALGCALAGWSRRKRA
jgi:hypothetical protein